MSQRVKDVFGIGEQGKIAPGDVFGWLAKTRIERWLSATRLARREVNGNTQTMQQTHSGLTYLGIKHITQARDKQGHTCWSWPLRQPGHPGFSMSHLGRAQPAGISFGYP
jgi:hypothetical protein